MEFSEAVALSEAEAPSSKEQAIAPSTDPEGPRETPTETLYHCRICRKACAWNGRTLHFKGKHKKQWDEKFDVDRAFEECENCPGKRCAKTRQRPIGTLVFNSTQHSRPHLSDAQLSMAEP